MTLTFLGTGTSHGVPVIGCDCEVCRSRDPRDSRLRTSALVETAATRILIDCGPDLRQQMLGQPFRRIDGVLVTHAHYDHVGGLDDLRAFSHFGDLHIYADQTATTAIRHNFPYCFAHHLYPGVPHISLHTVEPHQQLRIGDISVVPIRIMHDQLPILGFRMGSLTYITDMKSIPDGELPYLRGTDTLVVNALRWERPHHSHQLVADAVDFARRVGARRTYLTHLTHRIGLTDWANAKLPAGIQLACDGMRVEIG